MKKTKVFYWIFTGLAALAMGSSSIPDILNSPEAAAFITKLGYPGYIVAFLGVAKLLGVIAILIPGFPRIKEWAYAGLTFDLLGAFYSVSVLNGVAQASPMLIFIFLVIGSYYFYHKKLKAVEPASVAA